MNKKKLNIALWLIVLSFWFMQFKEAYIERVNFFPYWLSGFLLLGSVCLFQKDVSEMKLLKPLCIIIGCMDFSVWLMCVLRLNMPFQIYLLKMLSSVITLYTNYQLITNLIQFADNYGFENTKPLKRLRLIRTIYITAFTLFLPLYNTLDESVFTIIVEWSGWYIAFCAVIDINRFRKDFFSYIASVERFSDTPKW